MPARPSDLIRLARIGLILVLIVSAAGCSLDPETPASVRRQQLARVQRELRLEPPYRYLAGAAIDDGGTGVIDIAGAGPETLHVFTDNRPFAPHTAADGSLLPPGRHVWLDGYPLRPASRRLEFGSAAESAVVDLLQLQVAALMSATEESSLVRAERRALHPKGGEPSYQWSIWYQGLDRPQRDVLFLRAQIAKIVYQRGRRWPDQPGDTLSCLP